MLASACIVLSGRSRDWQDRHDGWCYLSALLGQFAAMASMGWSFSIVLDLLLIVCTLPCLLLSLSSPSPPPPRLSPNCSDSFPAPLRAQEEAVPRVVPCPCLGNLVTKLRPGHRHQPDRHVNRWHLLVPRRLCLVLLGGVVHVRGLLHPRHHRPLPPPATVQRNYRLGD
jgi:hypothetical protein